MLKLIFGEMSQILTDSQFVSAEKIEKAGFSFKFPDLRSAFSDLFEIESLKGVKKRNFYQWVDSPRNEVCEFFSEAKNLESITPKWLEFQVQEMSTEKIEKGSLIDYRLKIRGLPVKWRSEISEWNLPSHFVDRQVKGPYRCWHHTHSFSEVEKGTLVEDKVAYKMPFPILGDFVEKLWVSSDVYKIFTHRKKRVEEIFS